MGKVGWISALFLVVVLAVSSLSLLMVRPASAQTIPNPSVPEFTLRYVDHSYDVPSTTTSTTDPYTGKVTTTTISGYHVENKSIQVIITNPPFQSYQDESGGNIDLYYRVLFKGHFAQTWNGISQSAYKDYYMYDKSAPTTVMTAPIYNVSDGGQVDVEVRALIGKFIEIHEPLIIPFMDSTGISYKFVGQAGDWSNTQTIRVPDGRISISAPILPNSTLSPIPTPTVPEFSWLAILPLLASMFAVALFVKQRNVKKLWLK